MKIFNKIIFCILIASSNMMAQEIAKNWEFNDVHDSRWVDTWARDMKTRKLSNGIFLGESAGKDPYIPINLSPALDSTDVKYIKIRMKVDTKTKTPQCVFYFNLGIKDESTYVKFDLIHDGKFHDYVVPLSRIKHWKKIKEIKKIRFDPINNGMAGDRFEVDYIRLMSGRIGLAEKDSAAREPNSETSDKNTESKNARLKVIAPKLDSSITLDGKLDEKCWQQAAHISNFFDVNGSGFAKEQTKISVFYDKKYLYINFSAEIDNVSYIASRTQRDDQLWKDDCMELFIAPNPEKPIYYHIIVNPKGIKYDSRISLLNGKWKTDTIWNGKWEFASNIKPGAWNGEFAIPFSDFETSPETAESWLFNIARGNKSGGELSSWVPTFGSFHNPGKFGMLTWGNKGNMSPGIEFEDWGNQYFGKNKISFTVKNQSTSDLPLRISTQVIDEDKLSKTYADSETLKVPSKKEKLDTITYEIKRPGKYRLSLKISDGKNYFFFAQVPFIVEDLTKRLARLQDKLSELKNVLKEFSGEKIADIREKINSEQEKAQIFLKKLKKDGTIKQKIITDLQERISVLAEDTYRMKAYVCAQKQFSIPDPSYGIGVETTMRKVFKKVAAEQIEFKGHYTNEVKLSACRREYEGFQTVIIPFDKDIKNIKITASELVNKKTKQKIAAENVKIFIVGYISTSESAKTKYKVRYRGDWPDPLMPNKAFNVARNDIQPIWINIYIPPETAEGEYDGHITISPQNADTMKLKLKVQVWDFELPKKFSLRTAVSMNTYHLLRYYHGLDPSIPTSWPDKRSKKSHNILKNYWRFLLEHRINPTNIYDGSPPRCPGKEDLAWCKEMGMNAQSIGAYNVPSWSWPVKKVLELQKFTAKGLLNSQKSIKDYYEYAKSIGFEKNLYVHIFDELAYYKHKEEYYPLIKKITKDIKTVAPDVKFECITEVIPELIGVIDIWCPSFGLYKKESAKFNERVKAGDELWLYTCLGTPDPEAKVTPSFVLEAEASDLRLIPWICWKYNATGFLYYAVNHWQINNPVNGKGWPEKKWKPMKIVGYNLDGVLMYPGLDGRPISSIRLENLRDGIEDYDYFTILKKAVKKAESRKLSSENALLLEEAKEILKINDQVVKDHTTYTKSGDKIYREREKVAGLIEKISKL